MANFLVFKKFTKTEAKILRIRAVVQGQPQTKDL
jgi:hypothetical protein